MTQQELDEIVERHGLWLNHKEGGARADFSGKDIRYLDLSGRNLWGAHFREMILVGVSFNGTNLGYTDFRRAYIESTDFIGARLGYASFRHAYFNRVDFSSASCGFIDLRGAETSGTCLIALKLPIWDVYINAQTVQIGSWHHRHDALLSISDEEIHKMHPIYAADWWTMYKPLVVAAINAIKTKQEAV
jgi:hypothetical protein